MMLLASFITCSTLARFLLTMPSYVICHLLADLFPVTCLLILNPPNACPIFLLFSTPPSSYPINATVRFSATISPIAVLLLKHRFRMAHLRAMLRRIQTLPPRSSSAFGARRRFHLPPSLPTPNKREPPTAHPNKREPPTAQEIRDILREDRAEEQRARREHEEKEEQAFRALPWWKRYFKTAVKSAILLRGS